MHLYPTVINNDMKSADKYLLKFIFDTLIQTYLNHFKIYSYKKIELFTYLAYL